MLTLENPSPRQLPGHVTDNGRRAELYFNRTQLLPEKQEDGTLVFPWRDRMTFTPVHDGSQFVVTYPGTERVSDPIVGSAIFAGMDEDTFISRITDTAADVLKFSGEGAFFYTLKPEAIKAIENIHGDNGRTTIRQGDIWAHKLGRNWYDFLEDQTHRKHDRLPDSLFDNKVGNKELFTGIRHTIDGRKFTQNRIIVDRLDLEHVAVADGILSAPDHLSRNFNPGPHIFARTPHLLPPPEVVTLRPRPMLREERLFAEMFEDHGLSMKGLDVAEIRRIVRSWD